MAIYATDFAVRGKSDASPVTEADERAEAVIVQRLRALTPDIPIVAEEAVAAGQVPAVGRRFWLVDPLDGTKEFASRNGEFTVNIALIDGGVPVLGVVLAPAIGRLFAGAAGLGALAEQGGTRRTIRCRAVPPEGLTVVSSRSHGDAAALRKQADTLEQVQALRESGFNRASLGVQDIDDMQTVQALIILESVAKTAARYETPIKVPVTYPIPFTIAQEMVRGGCIHAGRPEQYDPDSVQFVSPEQFAFVAAVTGVMMRDKPAAHIFLGAFFAESLLLAETGFATGAIQVAGTANADQLPFFVVACDYTLIGEELFAASAYLSGEPKLVGSLKGADLMKIVIIALVVTGCVLETFGVHGLVRWLATQ